MHQEILRMEHISVTQDGIPILENTWINLFRGEVIGLLGLNDSGKSTMMHVLAGFCPHYTGNIFLEEHPVSILSQRAAQDMGIFMIEPELSLISDFTVSENIFLVAGKHFGPFVNAEALRKQTEEIFRHLQITLQANRTVARLSYYQRFLVELCKAVAGHAKIIIVDIVLSKFPKDSIEEIRRIFSLLRGQGVSLILLDHHMRPIFTLCERIFVLRLGRTVGVSSQAPFCESILFSQMLGALSSGPAAQKIETNYKISQNIELSLEHVCIHDVLEDVSFQIHTGEILGLISIDDPDGTVFTDILLGKIVPGSGTVTLHGRPLRSQHKDSSISFVMEPYSLFPHLTVQENVVIPAMEKKSNPLGIMNIPELRYLSTELISQYIPWMDAQNLLSSSMELNSLIRVKICLCNALVNDPRCVVFVNPTQRIDVTSKDIIYRDIVSLKEKGISSLVISLSLDELTSVCDRIVVIKAGRLKESLSVSEILTKGFVETYGKYLSEF